MPGGADTLGRVATVPQGAGSGLVVVASQDFTCGVCGRNDNDLLVMQDTLPHCLSCAGIRQRAARASPLSAVVVELNRSVRRYRRDARRRKREDVEFTERLTDEIRRRYPGCPAQRGARARRRRHSRDP
jgi:hypothetical protein